jgi:predicted nucleic acid-binding protein
VTLYAESSAVLAWLLDEGSGREIRDLLASADVVVSSDLTVVECHRVLMRAAVVGELTGADATARRRHLTTAAAHWHVLRLSPAIMDRARQPFPGEPIRTLDAIHLAAALSARAAVPALELLTLDERIRTSATQLGLLLQPA